MRILKSIALISIITLCYSLSSIAQSFVTPISSITGDATVITQADQTIQGKIVAALTGMKGLTSLTLKDLDGQKHKFKAVDIKSIKIKVDNLAKLEMIANKTENLEKLFEADFDEIVDRKFIYYKQVKVPGKDRYVLSQLLNPGFNNKISVFDKPGAKTGETSVGGMAVSGNRAKAYYIIVNGKAKEISKSKYRKGQFNELFESCPAMIQFYSKPNFSDFAQHVLYYELNCR